MLITETAVIGILVLALLPTAGAALSITQENICRPAVIDDFNVFPGSDTFKDDITQDFGKAPESDSWTMNGANMGNPVRGDGEAVGGAMICISSNTYVFEPDWDSLYCYSAMVDFDSEYDKATGYIMTTVSMGYSVTSQFQIQHTSSLGHDFSTEIRVELPGGGKSRTYMETISMRVENSQMNSTSININKLENFVATANIHENEKCTIQLNVTTCTMMGLLNVPIAFTGWVGFGFDHEVTYTGQGKDNKHKDWQANPSISYGMLADQLSSNMTFSGSLSSKSSSLGVVSCRNATHPDAKPVTRPITLTPVSQNAKSSLTSKRAKRSMLR